MSQENKKSYETWQEAQAAGYVQHLNEKGELEGPEDAPIFYGQPVYGNPWRDIRQDPYSKQWVRCDPYIDQKQIAPTIGGCAVEWLAWDEATGCSVYKKLEPVKAEVKK